MEQEILEALRPEFPDVQGSIALEPATDRYNGHIVSQGFQTLSFVERQRRVFDRLRAHLGPEAQLISMLFTYTPAEYEQLQAA
jgi:acid stress-induced BolA-like protein IbaG/YrbA